MSRTSRITETLNQYVEEGIIEGFTTMAGLTKTNWLVQVKGHQAYFTSSEAEAFISGVAAAKLSLAKK